MILYLDRERAKRTAREVAVQRVIAPPRRSALGHFPIGHGGNPSGKRRGELPRQQPPSRIADEYARELTRVIGSARAAYARVLEDAPRLAEAAARRHDAAPIALDFAPAETVEPLHDRWFRFPTIRLDAGEGDQAAALLAQAAAAFDQSVEQADVNALAKQFAAKTATYQRIQLGRQVRAGLGANVLTTDPHLPGMVADFAHQNVALIKRLADRVKGEVETMVLGAISSGTLKGKLAQDLAARFGIAERHARVIARDQVGKMYANINHARQRELGVTRFRWRTSRDARVRPRHRALEGKIWQYADPPAEGMPGTPVLCRCTADPIFDDILAELEAEPSMVTPAKPAPAPEPKPAPAPPPPPPSTHFSAKDLAPPPGLLGHAVEADSDIIEGNAMRIRRVKGGHEVTFKLGGHGAKEMLADLGDAEVVDFTMRKRSLVDGALAPQKGSGQAVGQAKIYKMPGYTLEVGQSGPSHSDNHNTPAVANMLRLTIKGSPEKIEKALEHLGNKLGIDRELLARTTKEAAAERVRAGVLSKFEPDHAALVKYSAQDVSSYLSTVPKNDPMHRAIADAKVSEVYPGHVAPRSESLGQYLGKNIEHLIHDGEPSIDAIEKIIGGTGLMSSTERYQAGIFSNGLSTLEDFKTGGADGVFTRVVKTGHDPQNMYSGVRFVIDKRELERLDFWAFPSDEYGIASPTYRHKRWKADEIADSDRPRQDNEVIFQKGVPSRAISRVEISPNAGDGEKQRQELIERFRKNGVEQINGVPLDDYFVIYKRP